MVVDDAGQEDGQSLSDRHHDGEGDRAKLGDGVKDEELASGGAHTQNADLQNNSRVPPHEDDRLEKPTLLQQRRRGEKTREEVHSSHHLDGRHLVGLEQFPLPVGRETVKQHVA